MRVYVYETLGYADIIKRMQKNRRPKPGGVMAQAEESNFHSEVTPGLEDLQVPALQKGLSWVGLSPSYGSSSEGHTTGLCAHCLLCLHWSRCLFLFTFVHIKYWCLCSRTVWPISVSYILEPLLRLLALNTHWCHAVLKHAGQGVL